MAEGATYRGRLAPPSYRERLTPPLGWWVAAAGLAGMVGVAVFGAVELLTFVSASEYTWAVTGFIVFAGFASGALIRYAVAIRVDDQGVRAGRARLPWSACGRVETYDGADTKAAFGVNADARAYLVLRSYCPSAVKVTVDDLSDPTPYWLISTRRPEQLSRAITRRANAAVPD